MKATALMRRPWNWWRLVFWKRLVLGITWKCHWILLGRTGSRLMVLNGIGSSPFLSLKVGRLCGFYNILRDLKRI
jgi:hypothetical protein